MKKLLFWTQSGSLTQLSTEVTSRESSNYSLQLNIKIVGDIWVPLKAYYMLPVNGLQLVQTHEAEALPSYASMDGFPTKSKHTNKDKTVHFPISGKASQIIRNIQEGCFATWMQYDIGK